MDLLPGESESWARTQAQGETTYAGVPEGGGGEAGRWVAGWSAPPLASPPCAPHSLAVRDPFPPPATRCGFPAPQVAVAALCGINGAPPGEMWTTGLLRRIAFPDPFPTS